MDQTADFKSLQADIQAALVATTRTSGQIATEDLAFHRSFNPEVGTALDEQSERILALSRTLLKSATSLSDIRAPVIEDTDDVENNWRTVVDVVDSLLEKTDICLDEYTGVSKRKAPKITEPTQDHGKGKRPYLGTAFRTQNLLKPQLAFDVKPDNNDVSPWKPLLTSKPHAIVPLEESLGMFKNEYGLEQYHHPYETEINQLQYPAHVFQKADPIPYLPFETTTATFVDTEEGVLEMLEELRGAPEIAIDLEHHDARSYVGLVSLMQISIRNKDWIVDTLKPWRQNLQVLNEVFADPNVVKVFHGAFMDIVWLQRDLGLYVVGLFDTHWACRSLRYEGGGLAFLLKKFINFDADKKYQLADWRIRPLPEEMFFYARADTHFLLYIYDNVRNELIDTPNDPGEEETHLEHVLAKSKEVSLLQFERQIYNAENGKGPGGWYTMLMKNPPLFSPQQFSVFRAVHGWRDKVAREDDDSTTFLMPNHVLFSLANLMPMDMVALLGIAHPISHSVKSRAGELLEVIKTAKARGVGGPKIIDLIRPDSLGAIARAKLPKVAQQTAAKTLVAEVDGSELRSDNSTFWGGAFGSSIWEPTTPSTNDNITLAVPLPALSSDIFETSLSIQSKPVAAPPPPKVVEPKPEPPNDEAFILKRGQPTKRKSESIESEEMESDSNNEYDISLNDNDEIKSSRKKATSKAERKRQKKAAKKSAQSSAGESGGVGDDGENEEEEEEEEVFDYSKAETVLHGKKKEGMGGKADKRKKKDKPFDPYSKSADAGKGMRRVQSERAGRSHTFKK